LDRPAFFYNQVDIPEGSRAEVTLPTDLFEHPECTMDGSNAEARINGLMGKHSLVISGKLKALASPAASYAPRQ